MSGRDLLDVSDMRMLASRLPDAGHRLAELTALAEQGTTAIVRLAGDPEHAWLRAGTTVDLHAEHIGRQVLVAFAGDEPVVIGVLRGGRREGTAAARETLSVDVDGERVVVKARRQLVLRCGQASITLTAAGKVLIEGTYVLSRSTGANSVQGGSIQLN
jgi:hypothetical protein